MGRKRTRPGKRVVMVLDAELVEALHAAVQHPHTISGFVQDAIAVRLARHESTMEYVRGKREKTEGRTPLRVFDPTSFDAYGFPIGKEFYPDDPAQEIRFALHKGPDGVRRLLRQWWNANGLNPDDYTDAMVQETLRVAAKGEKAHAK